MKDKSYAQTISAKISPGDAQAKISDVYAWWAKNFEGKASSKGDEFTVRFGNGDMYKLKVAEIIPGKKIVWDVIDAHQTWVKDAAEWVGTQVIWEISEKTDSTEIHFTHQGLVPELECFNQCQKGWNYLMLDSLTKLLSTGRGAPA